MKSNSIREDLSQPYSINAYVLGIKDNFRNPDLLNQLKSSGQFNEVKMHFGVDARTNTQIHQSQDLKGSEFWHGRALTPGEVACALGHKEMVMMGAESGCDVLLIMEDDAIYDHRIVDVVTSDFMCSSEPRILINSYLTNSVLIGKIFATLKDFEIRRAMSLPQMTQSYVMNRSALIQLSSTWENKQIYSTADYPPWYSQHAKFFLVFPPLQTSHEDLNSLIGKSRRNRRKMFKKLMNYTFLSWLLSSQRYSSLGSYSYFFHGRALKAIKNKILKRFGVEF